MSCGAHASQPPRCHQTLSTDAIEGVESRAGEVYPPEGWREGRGGTYSSRVPQLSSGQRLLEGAPEGVVASQLLSYSVHLLNTYIP